MICHSANSLRADPDAPFKRALRVRICTMTRPTDWGFDSQETDGGMRKRSNDLLLASRNREGA